MPIIVSYFTNVGTSLQSNEDSLVIDDHVISGISMDSPLTEMLVDNSLHLLCIADGIGGHLYGDIAGKMVLEYMKNKRQFIQNQEDVIQTINEAKISLNEFISENPTYYNFGTTIAGILINQTKCIFFNSGDSRIYSLNCGFFKRITHDHSLVETLYSQRFITEDEMRTHPQKNVLTSAILGDLSPDRPEVFIKEFILQGDDLLFICSDGIWETLSIDEIEEIYNKNGFNGFSKGIFNACMKGKARDNISMIAVYNHSKEVSSL